MGAPVTLVDPNGVPTSVDSEDPRLPGMVAQGYRVEGAAAQATREQTDARNAAIGPGEGFAHGLASTVSLGGFDVGARVLGGEDAARHLAQVKEAQPGQELAGSLTGMVIDPLGTVGAVGRVGKAVEGLGEGAGLVGRVGARLAGGAAEGAIYGAGQGVSDLALSQDPLTVEHIAGTLSSNMLYGGLAGAALAGAGGAFEKGLSRAKGALDEAAAARRGLEGLPEDLAGADAKGLRAAEKTELDAIEQSRVPQRATLADDIAAHRAATREDKLFLVSKGGGAAVDGEAIEGVKEMAARAAKADSALRGLTDNPIAFAERPQRALEALQRQQAAYEGILAKEPELRTAFAGDTSGTRASALDAMPTALERNKALQDRIRGLTAEPMSDRLSAIRDAKDALASGAAGETAAEKMVGGSAFSAAAGAMHALPVPGSSLAAAWVGGKASDLAKKLVFGKAGAAAAEAAAGTSAAIDKFLTVGAKVGRAVAPAVPVLATKVLGSVAYGPTPPKGQPRVQPHPGPDGKPIRSEAKLAELYNARSSEIRSQTALGPDGAPMMRPEARAAMADRLAPIRAVAPVLADRIETHGAQRIEYLASQLPRRPDLPGIKAGPDTWQPPDFEMRAFARKAAATENPGAVEHRVADGSLTPEDVHAYQALYPARAQALQQQILERLPELKKSLPYQRRVALTMLSGVAVDPSLDPRVISRLQSTFAAEPGTNGGTQAPIAEAKFGSVKKSVPDPTPAQSREQGARR